MLFRSLIAPPTVPGIQKRNSNPLRPLSAANSDNFLSFTPVPEIITSEFRIDNLLKFLPSFMTTPSKISSVISVFDPAPIT